MEYSFPIEIRLNVSGQHMLLLPRVSQHFLETQNRDS
jgi:hypothetical protein